MSPVNKHLALALCGVTLAAFTTQALAKPRHARHGHHRSVAAVQAGVPVDDRYSNVLSAPAKTSRRGRQAAVASAAVADDRFGNAASAMAAAPAAGDASEAGAVGGAVPQSVVGGSSTLVNEARRYIGGNPTGRGSLWCGAFMDMVLKRTGHAGGGNLARAYAKYGTRVSGPEVGAIAVMGRKGGGHVGVVSGIDANGNPIIISGNHNNRVAESVYPRARIITYVVPN